MREKFVASGTIEITDFNMLYAFRGLHINDCYEFRGSDGFHGYMSGGVMKTIRNNLGRIEARKLNGAIATNYNR